MINEDRIVDIELKLTALEDLVDTLNKTVYEQRKKNDELEQLCTALAHRVRDLTDASQQSPINERPPHY
jgi:SlyX protein